MFVAVAAEEDRPRISVWYQRLRPSIRTGVTGGFNRGTGSLRIRRFAADSATAKWPVLVLKYALYGTIKKLLISSEWKSVTIT
jgi:hypothetical protein